VKEFIFSARWHYKQAFFPTKRIRSAGFLRHPTPYGLNKQGRRVSTAKAVCERTALKRRYVSIPRFEAIMVSCPLPEDRPMLFSGVLMCGLFFPVPTFLGAATGLTALPVAPGQGPILAAFALRVGKEAEYSDRFFQCGMPVLKGIDPALVQALDRAIQKNKHPRTQVPAPLNQQRSTKILLFMNTGRTVELSSKEPIRHVLDASGKIILDLEPAKIRNRSGSIPTENEDSRIVSISTWLWSETSGPHRDRLMLGPQSPGMARIFLEGDSGKKELFDIIVLKSALAVTPGDSLRFQSASKKPIKQIEVENEKIVSVKVDPADPTRAVVKGLSQGFSLIRLNKGSDEAEHVEVAVYPDKITEDKVLILSAGKKDYRMRMSSEKVIAQVENSDDKVLEISTVTENPEQIRFTTLKPGFCRLKLVASDNSTESFAIFVRDTKE
jgi:hypothetical protein